MAESTQNTSKFKSAVKDLLPSIIMAFAFCFMLFVYEPLLMYSTNKLDFWFDLQLMAGPLLAGFGIFFLGAVVILTAAYFINKAIIKDKEPTVYRMTAIILFIVFLVTYFQGNLLAFNLPALDGDVINWDSLRETDWITLGTLVLSIGLVVFLLIKLGIVKTLKYVSMAAAALFLVLFISLVTTMITNDAFARKDGIISTTKNFNTMSTDKNFVIFLTDAVGSSEFKSVLEQNTEYKEVFEDFTYYPDTLGGYPCTRDTIPLVLGGALNKNETEFDKFSSNAYNNSPLFEKLTENGYDINLYESELIWYGDKKFGIANNAEAENIAIPLKTFWDEQMKYVMFKYLPYTFKSYSQIETMNFNGSVEKYDWEDRAVYNVINDNLTLEKTNGKTFRFIHTEGAHIPFDYDKDLNIIEGGTYEQKIEAVITMVNAYIERLKANGTYDNTAIVIMADHGNTDLNSADDMLVRANPMFMMKGINEHHDFTVSEKPLSYLDITSVFENLIDVKTAEEATADIPDKRERYFMWYRNFRHEDHIEEYVVEDKAWEWQKFKKTGNVYDLK